jgi:hypothetical protein
MNWYEDLFTAKTEPFPNFPDLHVHHGYEQNRRGSGREGELQQKEGSRKEFRKSRKRARAPTEGTGKGERSPTAPTEGERGEGREGAPTPKLTSN